MRMHQLTETSIDPALIPEAEIERYRELYRNHFGLDLTQAEALEQSVKLLSFFRWLYRPLKPTEARVFKHLAAAVKEPTKAVTKVGAYSKVQSGHLPDTKEASHD